MCKAPHTCRLAFCNGATCATCNPPKPTQCPCGQTDYVACIALGCKNNKKATPTPATK